MAQFGFCNLAAIPVRREPSDRSEMSTQLLFGDFVEILDKTGSWLSIKNHFDAYEGWIDFKQVINIDEDEYKRLVSYPLYVNRNLSGDEVFMDDLSVKLPAGCSFYRVENNLMKIGGITYRLEGKAWPSAFSGMYDLLKDANRFLGCPYLWGGKTYLGLDCSGLTQVVYKMHGISLLRDAVQQASQGEPIDFLSDSLPGDLAFFDNPEGRIVHVGIILDTQHILHCSGKVRIDTIDHQGIFNHDLNKYTHSLRLIKRVGS